jgi:hypothetical protein
MYEKRQKIYFCSQSVKSALCQHAIFTEVDYQRNYPNGAKFKIIQGKYLSLTVVHYFTQLSPLTECYNAVTGRGGGGVKTKLHVLKLDFIIYSIVTKTSGAEHKL